MTSVKKEVRNFKDGEGSESFAKIDFVSMQVLQFLAISLPLKRQKSFSANPRLSISQLSITPASHILLYI